MKRQIPQLAMTYRVLNGEGVYDLKEIAKEYHAQQTYLNDNGLWYYDRHLKTSSNSRGGVSLPSKGSYRDCSIWSINHYLGLNRHPYVINKAKEALDKYGTGCGTSAMSGGHSELHKNLQERFAKIFSKEEAILFPTGFTANLGTICAICKDSSTLILIDRNSHASIVEACKASGAKYTPFEHNSAEDLEEKLKTFSPKYKNMLVVVESVYSMEGDVAPLKEMAALKSKYNFLFYVDEAHSFGFYGKDGSGLCKQLGITDDVDFIMTTLSKATASIGGIVATSHHFASMLRWSNSYLFQASIPPADAAVVDACLDIIEREPEIIESLWKKANYLRENLIRMGFDIGHSSSPVIPLYIRDPQKLKLMEKDLFDRGVFTVAVPYPVVKASEVRFRFIVTNSHTQKDMDNLIEVLYELGQKYSLISK